MQNESKPPYIIITFFAFWNKKDPPGKNHWEMVETTYGLVVETTLNSCWKWKVSSMLSYQHWINVGFMLKCCCFNVNSRLFVGWSQRLFQCWNNKIFIQNTTIKNLFFNSKMIPCSEKNMFRVGLNPYQDIPPYYDPNTLPLCYENS